MQDVHLPKGAVQMGRWDPAPGVHEDGPTEEMVRSIKYEVDDLQLKPIYQVNMLNVCQVTDALHSLNLDKVLLSPLSFSAAGRKISLRY